MGVIWCCVIVVLSYRYRCSSGIVSVSFEDDSVIAYRCGAAALGTAFFPVFQDFYADFFTTLVDKREFFDLTLHITF